MFNLMKTAVLMAAITALFMAIGGMVGGRAGMMLALVVALGMNFFSYWFSDQMVLKMYNAREVDASSAPQFYGMVAELAQRAGLPIEITAEFDIWRRIRDSEGSEGWVLQSLLSGRRTSIIAPWKKGELLTLLAKPDATAGVVAKVQPGVIGNVKQCDSGWCRIFGDGFDGYIQQSNLWGVYPDEKL